MRLPERPEASYQEKQHGGHVDDPSERRGQVCLGVYVVSHRTIRVKRCPARNLILCQSRRAQSSNPEVVPDRQSGHKDENRREDELERSYDLYPERDRCHSFGPRPVIAV